MAKKDEEDMVEEYNDEEEEKPKKKAKKRRKSRTWIWIVAFVVILAILLFIRYKYSSPAAVKDNTPPVETAPPDEVVEQTVPEPDQATKASQPSSTEPVYEGPKQLGDQVVPREDRTNVMEVTSVTPNPDMLSNIQCYYDSDNKQFFMSLRVYNTLDTDMKIAPHGVAPGYNTYFKVRGVVVLDPQCDTEVLAPGEYTTCKKIGFSNPAYTLINGLNKVSIQGPGKNEVLLVKCTLEGNQTLTEIQSMV